MTNFYGVLGTPGSGSAPRVARRPRAGAAERSAPVWRFDRQISTMPRTRSLRVETSAPALVHWTHDRWRSARDDPTTNVGSGTHAVDLSLPESYDGGEITFTFYWPVVGRWEGVDFTVRLEDARPKRPSRESRSAGSTE
jgi:glucoamylase